MENVKKILIVENEALIALDIKSILIELGYSVISIVKTGEDALKIIPKEKPDLILMDVLLDGDLDGIETGLLVTQKYNIPLIYITAYAKETLLRSKAAESVPYLVKPFKPGELESTIKKLLQKKEEQ